MQPNTKTACGRRLKRIEGQVRGINRMIEEDRYCLDILAQLHAARAALRAVEDAVLGDHITHCVEDAIASGDPRSQREKLEELLEILIRRPECSMAE